MEYEHRNAEKFDRMEIINAFVDAVKMPPHKVCYDCMPAPLDRRLYRVTLEIRCVQGSGTPLFLAHMGCTSCAGKSLASGAAERPVALMMKCQHCPHITSHVRWMVRVFKLLTNNCLLEVKSSLFWCVPTAAVPVSISSRLHASDVICKR